MNLLLTDFKWLNVAPLQYSFFLTPGCTMRANVTFPDGHIESFSKTILETETIVGIGLYTAKLNGGFVAGAMFLGAEAFEEAKRGL